MNSLHPQCSGRSQVPFRVIHKENSGYGASMNVGLRAARGEYIGIVESDDFIKPEMFERLYTQATKKDAEVVKTNAYFYWTDTNRVSDLQLIDENHVGKVVCPREVKSNIFYKRPSIWSAIYKRDFLTKNKINFLPTPGASYQDTSFTFKVWLSAERVVFLDEAFLYYRQDNAASSMNNIGKKAPAIWREFDEIESFAKEKYPDEMMMIYERKFIHSYNFLLEMRGNDMAVFCKDISQHIQGYDIPEEYFQTKKLMKNFKMIQNNPDMFCSLKRTHMRTDGVKGYLVRRFMPSRRRKYCIKEMEAELADRKTNKGVKHFYLFKPEIDNCKISVIVTTHNDKEIVKKCVGSLKAQTHKNLEIIIVNDGSDDESKDIITKLAKTDSRIKVIETHESGVATARNKGLKKATGDYIMWCDSDDYYDKGMCKKMLTDLLETNSDFAICETHLEYEEGLKEELKQGVDDYLTLKFVGKQALNPSIITRTDASLWNKIYRRDIIVKNDINFPDGLLFEDAYFNDLYMVNSRSGDYMRNVPLYHYIRKNGSIMSKTFENTGLSADYRVIAFKLYDYLKAHGLYEKHHELFWLRFNQYCTFAIQHLPKDKKKEELKLIRDFVAEHKDEVDQESDFVKECTDRLVNTGIASRCARKAKWIIKYRPAYLFEMHNRKSQEARIKELEKQIQKEY